MVLYYLYKNMAFTLPQYYFSFVNGFSGQTLFHDWNITLFNSVFTTMPLMTKALFDFDVDEARDGESMRKCIPYLYYVGQMKMLLNP